MRSSRKRPAVVALAVATLAGCVTRGDLLEVERRVDQRMEEQARSIQDVQLEMERLRGSGEGRGVPSSRAAVPKGPGRKTDRAAMDKSLLNPVAPSQEIGMTLAPEGMSTEGAAPDSGAAAPAPAPAPAPPQPAGTPPAEPQAEPRSSAHSARPGVDESWRREVEQDRA